MKKALICVLLALAAFSANAQKKTKVAVFPFEVTGGVVNETEAIIIREDFSNRLAQTGLFELIPRTEVDKLFKKEAAFQLNDLSDAKKTAEYGRVLNADWIMAGRLAKVGSRIALVVTMYTYPDFVQKPGSQIYAPDIDTLVDSIPNMIADIQAAQGGGTTAAASAKPAVPPAATPARKAYKIGDIGPAGGIIFYDKGNGSGGWQYLEAAPASTEWQTIQWSSENFNVAGTRSEIGRGKKNTELIVNYAEQNDKSARAASVCDTLFSGGYDDWFLPSLDELDLMFKNLKQKGLGGFKDEAYWSSTQSTEKYAWLQGFKSGQQLDRFWGNLDFDYQGKTTPRRVRAIRQF